MHNPEEFEEYFTIKDKRTRGKKKREKELVEKFIALYEENFLL